MSLRGERAWEIEEGERVEGMQVVLLKKVYVLPWVQFLYGEGTGEEVRMVFSTHDVVVRGSGMEKLLEDMARQRVSVLKEPGRAEKFAGIGVRITEVEVHRVQTEGAE